jgi:molybdopterin/thiamine biosynthesis adenylyltransferase
MSVVLIGLGNTGGFAAGLLGRLPGLARLTLTDRDEYDESNLVSQDITAADVGTPKAVAQADRLRRINPSLDVAAVVDDVEFVPLALLRSDVLVACLDARRARQSANQAAWRLGIPWVDAGVRAEQSLARVNVYMPAADQPCLECAWDRRDYELVEQVYPCGGTAPAPATKAPASLGALAGALQVLECQKLLAGQSERAMIGKQVLFDAASHRHFVTSFRRNPACRFDHATWRIEPLDEAPNVLTVGAAFALAADGCDSGEAALRVEGQAFVTKLTCPTCGASCSLSWRLSGRLGAARQCGRCRRRMMAAGFDAIEWLGARHLPAGARGHCACRKH